MLERLIHEPLARVIGQPLLTLSSLNKIDLIDLILLYIFNPLFGVFFIWLLDQDGYQKLSHTQRLKIIGPSFYYGREISKVSENTDFKPSHILPGSTLDQTKRRN